MYTKTELFNDIVSILKNDYAGYEDKKKYNYPERYTVTNNMDDATFTQTIQEYLYGFKDGHLSFRNKKSEVPFRGFRVRRYEDVLYVTDILGELHLYVGDKIIAIDGDSINLAASRYSTYLQHDVFERQTWNNLLPFVEHITYERDGERYELDLSEYNRPAYTPIYDLKQLDENTVYIKLTDFGQSEPIQKMMEEHEALLNSIQNIIFDVRVNYGGNDLFYFPLVGYTIDETVHASQIVQPDEAMYTNYTANNCDLWIESLSDYLKQPLDEATKAFLEKEIQKFKTNYSIGMKKVEDNEDFIFEPKGNAQKVFILSDVTCGSSGETFIKNLKQSPKVIVIGRPTMGILDYFNVTTKNYGNFEFSYSISKISEKYHNNATGTLPHIHIPWTTQHLVEDVDLNYALSLRESVLTKESISPKEIIDVEMEMQTFDMSKSDTWTNEQWAIWRGDEYMYDDVGIKLLLLDDQDLFMKIMGISHNEITEAMNFNFDVVNKMRQPIALQFVEWTIEGKTFDLSHEPFIIINANSDVPRFRKNIIRSYKDDWQHTAITVNLLHAITFKPIRTLQFSIQKVFTQLF
ncbi:S41 family peptidase [Solibacillus sp. FSL K6-1781]|uniref:S41 family peptidase n=1 Tax=Solibacillus sp. FSL K6-1781 TaxID=2921474 RepID=UPI00315A111A